MAKTLPTHTTETSQRLEALRQAMATHGVEAYFVPAADEHLNEYLPLDKLRRNWLCGFTGSAGDLLVTRDAAFLFVDSRYYEQADQEVSPELVTVRKLGLEGHPGLTETLRQLAEQAGSGFRLGFDPFTLSGAQHQEFQRALGDAGVVLTPLTGNWVDALWHAAPEPPVSTLAPVLLLPDAVAGEGVAVKLKRVREGLQRAKANVLPLTKLDQIAWLFNLRGQDIPYNPVFIAYALVTLENAHLFTALERLNADTQAWLSQYATLHPYEAYLPVLSQLLTPESRVLIDGKHTTFGTQQAVMASSAATVTGEHPVQRLKAVKNPVEIQGMQTANLRASRAKIRALYWLEGQLRQGNRITEAGFAQALEGFYAEEPGFRGLSFNTIAGAGAHSSIVHYGTPDPETHLEPGELFLIDSGIQCWGPDWAGTTDDTRTVIIGEPTALQKQRYTRVLQAHIRCAAQRLPKGTEGTRLDGITRAVLWQDGLDYGHGTGHGVGAFLNVHEGPNGIHRLASEPFQPGMITSIEPGYYEPGWGGIRLENLYVVREITPAQGTKPAWYGFEPLTYIPFDTRLIDWQILSPEDGQWLAAYHQAVVEKIAPTLPPEEAAQLSLSSGLAASRPSLG